MAHFKRKAEPMRRQNTTYKPPFPRGRKVRVFCSSSMLVLANTALMREKHFLSNSYYEVYTNGLLYHRELSTVSGNH